VNRQIITAGFTTYSSLFRFFRKAKDSSPAKIKARISQMFM